MSMMSSNSKAAGSHSHCSSASVDIWSEILATEVFKVCQGPYDATLIQAWEAWDDKRGSENDHPKDFPEKQNDEFIARSFMHLW
ncbi:hypothetical protein Ahy_A06g027287 [Arachis hypogaea]|uniref:Uncharacterized protein n=1 Tax=Arachis hypogaea TaxID=3818 RepID=A0A445CN53_ARAHY|nr:hypothetical protein Ahy_A06g027287 [Arachis hypogaea]